VKSEGWIFNEKFGIEDVSSISGSKTKIANTLILVFSRWLLTFNQHFIPQVFIEVEWMEHSTPVIFSLHSLMNWLTRVATGQLK